MRTLSVTGGDLDGGVADGIESLRQRVVQAVLLRLGEWFLDADAGVPYPRLLGAGETSVPIAVRTITEAIIGEGGDEVLSVDVVRADYDAEARRLDYGAQVATVHGAMPLDMELA